MSHATGAVRFSDGTVKFYEYNGTNDVCISRLYDTMQEVSDNWRKGDWLLCKCPGGEEVVEIYTAYGCGFYWKGEACKRCRSITSAPFRDEEETCQDGVPSWWDLIPLEIRQIHE